MRSLLVACRGSIAARVAAACRDTGFAPVLMPDGMSTDSVDAIVTAARDADVVHPGCGATAEDPELPRRLAAAGVGFVGPPADVLARANDKAAAIDVAETLGIPVLPHASGVAAIERLGEEVGFPLVLKPRRGCGGSGVVVVRSPAALGAALRGTDAAVAADGGWYAETFLEPAVTVAVTVAVAGLGTMALLGERETLLAADSHKLLDASPITTIDPALLGRIRRDTVRLAAGLGLVNIATCEFIVGPAGYAFLEVNPRLAGGYRMCEAQTGVDLVVLQLEIAGGRTLVPSDVVVDESIHCMEGRLYRLAAATGPGPDPPVRLDRLQLAAEPGVSYDSTVDGSLLAEGPLLAQVLATGHDRRCAAGRLLRAVERSALDGVRHHGDGIAARLRTTDLVAAVGRPSPGEPRC